MADSNFDSIKLDKTAKISSPSAVASVGVPTKAEFDTCVLLLNEIKIKLNLIFQV